VRKTRTNTGYHRSLKLRRHLPEVFTCLCCGGEFQKEIFGFEIAGYYANRRAGYVCICCLIDTRKRAVLEGDGFILPVYADVARVLKKHRDGEIKADFELNRQRQYKTKYKPEED
jgi:hypothetical protein